MPEPSIAVVSPELLARRAPLASIPFESTEECTDLLASVGQERAQAALRVFLDMRWSDYHAFVLGPPGIGKHALVASMLAERAPSAPDPPDLCYVHDFLDPHRPKLLELPAGRAEGLRQDLERIKRDLRGALTRAFDADDFRARMKKLEEEAKRREESQLEQLGREAAGQGIALVQTQMGFTLAPTRDGKVLSPEDFAALPAEEQSRLEQRSEALRERLQAVLDARQERERELREQVRGLFRETTSRVVHHLIAEVAARYQDVPTAAAHLAAVEKDVIENARAIAGGDGEDAELSDEPGALARYALNVLVQHTRGAGAPIVEETHPTIGNLIGRIEHRSVEGTVVTDFTLIRPGALHRASGGYLILEAGKLLAQPSSWEALKRALRSEQLRIESATQALGFGEADSLEPEPARLRAKVILLGDRELYTLLSLYDPEFHELFKIAADFEDHVAWNEANVARFARLVATIAKGHGVRPLDRGAVARVVEDASRRAADAKKLSVHLRELSDLLREADHQAARAEAPRITRALVQRALDARTERHDRVRDASIELMRRGTVLIDVKNRVVGQVNALAVVDTGSFAFGRPTRITARHRLGRGQIIDIEREVELGGAIHSKGVLILAGYLAARFATERPLSLAASLVFEQSYSPVEGDSASLAELCALLSSLASAPIKQALAVTGSVNQLGQVQAVGGVHEKVEGFFDVCRAIELTGDQGVVIPRANVDRLMLEGRVVEAALERRFQVFAVDTVDRAMELLTGLPAGERDPEGFFPMGSLNQRVEARLLELAGRGTSAG